MKFGVCGFIKNENLYLREWVEHYIKLDFDKVILYDNNDIDGEIPNIVIQDYIDKGIIEIHDYRGKVVKSKQETQVIAYNDCLEYYKDKLDWIGFFDTDEFLYIEDNKNIHTIFNEKKYNNFNEVIVNWYMIGGKALYYEDKPVTERFVNHISYSVPFKNTTIPCEMFMKVFIKPQSDVRFNDKNMHSAYSDKACTAYGINCVIHKNTQLLDFICHKHMYLKHYQFKSFNEFLHRHSKRLAKISIDIYKEAHGWSDEHEKMLQNFLKKNNITLK